MLSPGTDIPGELPFSQCDGSTAAPWLLTTATTRKLETVRKPCRVTRESPDVE